LFATIVLRIGAFVGSLSISLTEMALAILIILAVIRIYKTRDFTLFKKGFFIFYLLMIVAETVSTFAGVNPERSLKDFFSWWPLLYLPAVYILFEGRKKIEYLIFVFTGAIISSVYGMYQAAFMDVSFGRAIGFFSHALTQGNVLALVCITAIGTLLFYKFQKKTFYNFTLISFVITLAGLIASASRGPILAFLKSAFMMAVYRFKWRGLIASLILIAVVFVSASQVDSVSIRFKNMVKNAKVSTSSIGTRLVLWEAASEAIMVKPFFGYGKRNFKSEVSKYISVKTSSRAHAHNSYIQYTFLHGFFGLFAMLGFFGSIMFEIISRMHSGPFVKIAFFVLIVFLLEGLTENNFTDSEVAMMFCSLTGLMLAHGRPAIIIDNSDV